MLVGSASACRGVVLCMGTAVVAYEVKVKEEEVAGSSIERLRIRGYLVLYQ